MNTVTCDFAGRLANNLIQIAAMIGYAERTAKKWEVPKFYRHADIYRYFRNLPKFNGNIRRCHEWREPGFEFTEIPDFPGDVKLVGFYQSEKYFLHARENVLSAWNLKRHPNMEKHCSIHVRRGDYLQHSDSFPTVTTEYIMTAISEMRLMGFERFIVFSDDIAWCTQNIDEAVEFASGNPYDDLCMMSSCGAHIIANSSYSWLAAWANPNPDKIVITPHQDNWFGPGAANLDTKDLLPPSWLQIKFRTSYR